MSEKIVLWSANYTEKGTIINESNVTKGMPNTATKHGDGNYELEFPQKFLAPPNVVVSAINPPGASTTRDPVGSPINAKVVNVTKDAVQIATFVAKNDGTFATENNKFSIFVIGKVEVGKDGVVLSGN